jgi:hypothetical protein
MFPLWIWVVIAFASIAAAGTVIFGYCCNKNRSSRDLDEFEDFHLGRYSNKDSRYTETFIVPADGA